MHISNITRFPLWVSDLLPAEHQARKTTGGNKRGAGHRQGETILLMQSVLQMQIRTLAESEGKPQLHERTKDL